MLYYNYRPGDRNEPGDPWIMIQEPVNTNARLGNGCLLERGVSIGPSVLASYVTVGQNTIIGHGCHIGRSCKIASGIVIGDGCTIGECAAIGHDVPEGTVIPSYYPRMEIKA